MVYIHADNERRLPHNFDAACALYGAREQGQDIRLTTIEEVSSGRFDLLIPKHLFAGSVDFMIEVFKRRGKKLVPLNNLFYTAKTTTFAAAKNQVMLTGNAFIKPVHQKLFTGMVYSPDTIGQLSWLPEDTEVFTAQPFDAAIVSEERCYIWNGQVKDIRNYAGDFSVHADIGWVRSLVNKLPAFPVAYTMDVAVLADGKSVVVEFNDMWAIGNYGIENGIYYEMLRDRYFEIMEQAN